METIGMDVSGLSDVQFGDEIRAKEFSLRPQSGFINNGSYGIVPWRVRDIQRRYHDLAESHPDQWFRTFAYPEWTKAQKAVAQFVGADPEDVVFVVNASLGVNTVVRSIKLNPGDAIMASSLTYGSLKHLWMDMVENIRPGVEALVMEVKIPIVSEDALVKQYDDYLAQHPNVKFVLIDHISSPSSILMPVKRLAEVCHKHGAMVMVDGAHAPGQVHLNISDLGVDFYTGNFHKWVYTPRSCALLWVKREHHALVSPPQSSWEKGNSLSRQFFDQGTRDHTPALCSMHAIHFYQAIGGMDKIVGYISELAALGQQLLVDEAGLERLDIPLTMEAPNLKMVKLPGVPAAVRDLKGRAAGLRIMKMVSDESDVELVSDWVDKALYLRISPQVVSTLEDVRRIVPMVKRLAESCIPYSEYFA